MADVDQVIEDIERALKMEKLPPRQPPQPPQPQPQPQPPPPGEIARLFHSLKQLAQKEEEKASIDPKDKAFIAYSKAVSGAYAATFNALNLAGILLSYAIGTHSHHLNKHQNMHAVFIGMSLTSIQFSLLIAGLFHSLEKRLTGWVLIGMSLGFLPFSLLVAGFSHSLDERLNWINTMAYALIGEVLYMAVMCGLLSYYLIDFAQESLVIVCVMVTTVAIIVPPMIAYSRPNLLDLCSKNEDRHVGHE